MRRSMLMKVALAATLVVWVAPARAAQETPVTCGQVVSGTVKLANDLLCAETDGLIVGSDNTVIDLNGHRIDCIGGGYKGSCQGTSPPGVLSDPMPENGVDIDERHNVHVFTSVPGAAIAGFDNGVRIDGSTDVKVEHLLITGPPATQPANPRPPSHGVFVSSPCGGGHNHIGTGQRSGNDVSNHNQGIALHGGNCVNVVHNRVHDNNSDASVPSNGILVDRASHNVVRGNEVTHNGDEDSTIDSGIQLRREGTSDNLVTENLVTENLGDGISLRVGAVENFITNNTMQLNGVPLSGTVFYDAAGRGAPGGPPGSPPPLNWWTQNNRCLTQNDEVPPGTCDPDDVPPGEG